MKNALMLIAAGVALTAVVLGLGSFIVDNLPPFPTCAGLGGGCTSR